ncbi:MAG: hypothetical protein KJ658_00270 [Proteobacteria bacterium]|nr:hypothetical protein [Desulfobacula sp.]MBU3950541.1 hypothetical protein [Pseudomonadota bacterium]
MTPPQSQSLGCNAIVGKWKWFTGSTVDFGFNGEMTGNGNHWECLDNGRTFKIVWNNGQWIDTLTLSPDGMRLEGKNQFGSRVWGQRIGQAPAAGGSAGQAAVTVPIPAANKAYKVSGNMGAQWGLAHGSLKVNDPSKWVLATIAGVQLNFIDPYLQGKQSYIVRVFSKAYGTKLSETIIGRGFSGVMCHVSISPDRNNAQGWNTFSYKEE